MSEKWIKASEIGEYLYCQRAWWYRLQGESSANVQELALGSQTHARHGWGLRRVGLQRLAAYALIALAAFLIILQFLR
jgi:hypothetical protein